VETPVSPPALASGTAYDAAHDRLVLFNRAGQTWTCRLERVAP
jgi:hypothetical protein